MDSETFDWESHGIEIESIDEERDVWGTDERRFVRA
jgi:hypothetical protein